MTHLNRHQDNIQDVSDSVLLLLTIPLCSAEREKERIAIIKQLREQTSYNSSMTDKSPAEAYVRNFVIYCHENSERPISLSAEQPNYDCQGEMYLLRFLDQRVRKKITQRIAELRRMDSQN